MIRRVAVELTPDRTSESFLGFIASTVAVGTKIHTDQWKGYNGLPRIGYPHATCNQSQEFVSAEGVHTQGIESAWHPQNVASPTRCPPTRHKGGAHSQMDISPQFGQRFQLLLALTKHLSHGIVQRFSNYPVQRAKAQFTNLFSRLSRTLTF